VTPRAGPWATALLLALAARPAVALTSAERDLLRGSLRDGEAAKVEAALGPTGLDGLPFLTLELALDLTLRTVKGHARIDWPNDTGSALLELPLRIAANGAGPPLVTTSNVRASVRDAPLALARVRREGGGILRVTLPAAAPPGTRIVLALDLEGRLPDLPAGATDPAQAGATLLGSGGAPDPDGRQYGTWACADDICTLTGFAPAVPAFIGGEFDLAAGSGVGDATYSEPMNALFAVETSPGVTLAATGREVGRVSAGEGRRRTTFAIAAAREIGVVASDRFVVDEELVDGVRVRSLSLADDRESGRRVLKVAAGALRTFDKALGRYPWATLDVSEAGLTGGAGGLELPSMALGASGFYRQQGGGLMGLMDPLMTVEILDFVTRHEVAHQWWHAQVGSHAQRHPYVDEPLAQWSALLATRRTAGKAVAQRARDMQVALNFQALQLFGLRDGKVARPASTFKSSVEYAALVYGKAPLFYEALAGEIGETALLSALRAVAAKWRFKRLAPEDLRDVLLRSSGGRRAQVEALWRRWFEQAKGNEDIGPLDLSALVGGSLATALGGAGGLASLPGLLSKKPRASGLDLDDPDLQQALTLLRELTKGLPLDELGGDEDTD
jgi:hypothetical protein